MKIGRTPRLSPFTIDTIVQLPPTVVHGTRCVDPRQSGGWGPVVPRESPRLERSGPGRRSPGKSLRGPGTWW